MKTRYHLLFIAAVITVLVSCQKEKSDETGTLPTGNGNPTDTTTPVGGNSEVGTWKLLSVHLVLRQTTEYTQSGVPVKAVTPVDYTTANNTGTLTFDGSHMTTKDISFAVNANTQTYIYLNGFLYDSLPYPVTSTIQAQDTTTSYTKIGTDSLYFAAGGLVSLGSGGLLPNVPSGAKLTFTSATTMIMASTYDSVTTDNSLGFPATVTTHAVVEATLQKQ